MVDLLTWAMVGSALLGLGFGVAIGALATLWWLSIPPKDEPLKQYWLEDDGSLREVWPPK